MTREEIEKLSVVEPYRFESHFEEIWYKVGCIDGLKAADAEPNLEILWHDASEEPRYNELMLGIDSDGVSLYKWCGQGDSWESFCGINKLVKWAYISDLLPKGDER